MKFKTRRLTAWTERLAGRSWEDVAPRLEDFLRGLVDAWVGGIPPGFNAVSPTTIHAGVVGDPGSEGSGWMSASATIPIETGPSHGLSNSNSEGSGTALMRADAGIKRDVRIYIDGVELSTRNALDLVGLIVTDDAANDRVRIAANSAPSAAPVGDFLLRQSVEAYALRDVLYRTYR